MKKVILETNVYEFNELSNEAKEIVKNKYLESIQSEDFEEICLDELNSVFKSSILKIQFSLNSCQGDGFNIYGTLNLNDILGTLKDSYTGKEIKVLKYYINNLSNKVELKENNDYCYSLVDKLELTWEDDYLDNYGTLNGYNKSVALKFESDIKNYLEKLCNNYEKMGYGYFYEIEPEELEEICDDNELVFNIDGTMFLGKVI